MNSRVSLRLAGLFVLGFSLVASSALARPLRLFAIGNSFSRNATHYLPDLAAAGRKELVLGQAQTGGCSLERHWNAVEAFLANPNDPKARIYGGKSLPELIGDGTWDIITIQQYSLLSGDVATYHPYVEKLCAYLRQIQPGAEIVVHQTWAYRTDAPRFCQIAADQFAVDQRQMWEKSRAAYGQIARQLGLRLIPVGDAFWQVDSDPQWGYRLIAPFDEAAMVYPAVPAQPNSLHAGYRWDAARTFVKDANHANVAGEYLGALVWYGVLFGESPETLTFVPPGIDPGFAAHLRRVAADTVREAAASNRQRVNSPRPSPPGIPKRSAHTGDRGRALSAVSATPGSIARPRARSGSRSTTRCSR